MRLCAKILLVVAVSLPIHLPAQALPFEKIYVATTAEKFRFETGLFSLEPGIKKHPNVLSGDAASVAIGYQFTKSFSLEAMESCSRSSGTGTWLNVDGLPPDEAAYLPVAKGLTDLRICGTLINARRSFMPFWRRRFRFYGEGGGGYGVLIPSFNGVADAVDPTDGQSFQVPASDRPSRHVPLGLGGGGAEMPLFGGSMAFSAGYRWEEGSAFVSSFRYFLFRRTRVAH